jgi:hypothetical protein
VVLEILRSRDYSDIDRGLIMWQFVPVPVFSKFLAYFNSSTKESRHIKLPFW